MAGGFKKKLPMSAALRQGGAGTVPPPKPGGGSGGGFDIGSLKGPSLGPSASNAPKAPTKIGQGVPTPKMRGGGVPTIPKMPKIPKFK